MGAKNYRRSTKRYRPHRRPFDRSTLDREAKLCGVYGLGPKREILITNASLMKLRTRARVLMNLHLDDQERIIYEPLLIRKCKKLGLLKDDENDLEQILNLTTEDMLNRRLQTIVFNRQLAKSIHDARMLISGGHISVDSKVVRSPGFLVRKENENKVAINKKSCLITGKPGRTKKKKVRAKAE